MVEQIDSKTRTYWETLLRDEELSRIINQPNPKYVAMDMALLLVRRGKEIGMKRLE